MDSCLTPMTLRSLPTHRKVDFHILECGPKKREIEGCTPRVDFWARGGHASEAQVDGGGTSG